MQDPGFRAQSRASSSEQHLKRTNEHCAYHYCTLIVSSGSGVQTIDSNISTVCYLSTASVKRLCPGNATLQLTS